MIDPLLRQLLKLLEPIGFIWLCLLVTTIVLWRARERFAARATVFLALLIFVVGGTPLSGWLITHLEKPYLGRRIAELPECDAVVVLGGGAAPAPREAGGVHFTSAADRVLFGVELMRLRKAPVLVLGGGASAIDGREQLEAELVAGRLRELGLVREEIITLGRNRNTHDEALNTARLAQERGWSRILLVTSAYHMRRAEALFRTAGVRVVPAACNFRTPSPSSSTRFFLRIPTWHGFETLSLWIHEQAGWAVYRWRGWIRPGR